MDVLLNRFESRNKCTSHKWPVRRRLSWPCFWIERGGDDFLENLKPVFIGAQYCLEERIYFLVFFATWHVCSVQWHLSGSDACVSFRTFPCLHVNEINFWRSFLGPNLSGLRVLRKEERYWSRQLAVSAALIQEVIETRGVTETKFSHEQEGFSFFKEDPSLGRLPRWR